MAPSIRRRARRLARRPFCLMSLFRSVDRRRRLDPCDRLFCFRCVVRCSPCVLGCLRARCYSGAFWVWALRVDCALPALTHQTRQKDSKLTHPKRVANSGKTLGPLRVPQTVSRLCTAHNRVVFDPTFAKSTPGVASVSLAQACWGCLKSWYEANGFCFCTAPHVFPMSTSLGLHLARGSWVEH